MSEYRPRVISLTKTPGHTFGFYLRLENGEEGHLVRCLEMGGPAELAGIRDGDRILRVNGAFVDGLSHSEVVEMVRNSGASVTFHILDEASYKQAKAHRVTLSDTQSSPAPNDLAEQTLKSKLCYLVKSSTGYGFSIRTVKGMPGFYMTNVAPGGVAHKAGVKDNDRLLEINGENIESSSHNQIVDKIKLAGSSMIFLLIDEEADEYYKNKRIRIGARLPTVKHLPHKPRIIDITKGFDGYGFMLREEIEQTGHFIKDIDRGSPAERAGLKEMDRLIAVDGQEVDGCSHEQVVNRIRQSGNKCSLLVVDKDTDQMYKLGQVSPMLFYEDMMDSISPPSYTEAINLPLHVQPSTQPERKEELKPKLCKMEKTSNSYGFHLNGIQGVRGQHVERVVKGGLADRTGMEDGDMVVEVNGVNVEMCHHEEVVDMIQNSGNYLEMLVASKSVYDQLKARGVTITRKLLEETHAQIHSTEDRQEEKHGDSRPETPTEPARQRSSSSSSEDSVDERF